MKVMTISTPRRAARLQHMHAMRWAFMISGLMLLSLMLLFGLNTPARAQAPAPAASAPAKTIVAQLSAGLDWADLTPAQREILQPLAPTWPSLSQGHKRKWIQVARSYPTLGAEEQAKMQGRMKEWVALSPQQRAQARLNFATTKELSKELTAEEKKAKWQAYQSLSEEEKKKLAAKAPPKPLGAALAPKPVSPQKLATVPSNTDKQKVKPVPKIAGLQPAGNQAGTAPAAVPAVAPGATQTPAQ